MTVPVESALPARVVLPWPMLRTRSGWRAPLAAAALVTAAAHVPVTGEHLHEAFYIGVLFIALEAASVLLAISLLRRPTRATLLLTAVVGGLAILALVISRTVGLPLIGDDIGNWTEPLALVSLAAEALMVVGGVAALLRPSASRGAARVGLAAGALVLVLGCIATGVATAAQAGDEDMAGMDMPAAAMPR